MRTRNLFLSAILVLGLLMTGCSDAANPASLERSTPPTAVIVEKPQIMDLEVILTFPTQIKPAKQIAITSKLAGKVSNVFVDLADKVSVGTPLLALDTTDIHNSIKSLEAQIAIAEAGIRSATTGVYLATGSQLQSQILQASGGIQQAQSAYEQAQIGLNNAEQTLEQASLALQDLNQEYEVSQLLYEIGEVTKRQIEQIELGIHQAELRVAQAQLACDQATVLINQASFAQNQAQSGYEIVYNDAPKEALQRAEDALNQVIAQRDALLVQLETAQSTLNDAILRSTIDGQVSSRAVEVGQLIAQSSVPFILIQADTVYASINVSENQVTALSIGQILPVKIGSLNEEAILGTIEVIAPAAAANTAAFEVRVALDNSDGRILPGMYADVSIIKDAMKNATTLPVSAVLNDSETSHVFLMVDGRAVRQTVRTGLEANNRIAILEGIEENDQVIVKGHRGLLDGVPVQLDTTGSGR